MSGPFQRIQILRQKFKDRKYREAYVTQHLKTFLASQIRALRGTLSQTEFGRFLGKPQSVVSRLESSDYGKLTLQTLQEIAGKMDVALIVRFVSHDAFLKITEDFSEEAYRPPSYKENAASEEIRGQARELTQITVKTSDIFWSTPHGAVKHNGWSPKNYRRVNNLH